MVGFLSIQLSADDIFQIAHIMRKILNGGIISLTVATAQCINLVPVHVDEH